MSTFRQTVRIAMIAGAAACTLLAQRSALVAHRNLGELTQRAETIVRGHVVAARVEPHPQFQHLSTVVVTLRVEKVLKGSATANLTFRQFVWDVRDKYDAARYRKGQEVLLLLNPVSEYGLTSPAGMEQGRFLVVRRGAAPATAVNGMQNSGLFDGLQQHAASRGVRLSARAAALEKKGRSGPVRLDDLEEAISAFAGAGR